MIPEICDPEIEWVEDPMRADGRIISDQGDHALAVAVEHGRGSASAADVSARIYLLFTFRAGKVLRYEEFYDERNAQAALER